MTLPPTDTTFPPTDTTTPSTLETILQTSTTETTTSTLSPTTTIPETPEFLFLQDKKSSYEAETPAYSVKFAETLDDGVEVSSGNTVLTFKPKPRRQEIDEPKTKPKNKPLLNKNKIKYASVSDGIDYEYELQADLLKERITINDYKSIENKIQSDELAIDFTLNYSDNTYISLDGQNKWDGAPISTQGKIYLMRKRQAGILYLSDTAFEILEPYATDAKGDQKTLTYTLTKINETTLLTLHTPQKYLKKAQYPVTLDPTLNLSNSDLIKWQTAKTCSTNTNACTSITNSPTYAWFQVIPLCYSVSPSNEKLMFRFSITCLPSNAKINSAKLNYYGTCTGYSNMPTDREIDLWQISSFSGTPTCSSQVDANVVGSKLVRLMNKTQCISSGSRSVDITTRLQTAITNYDQYLAFKLDITPELLNNTAPTQKYSYKLNTGNYLTITYNINCSSSYECGLCSPVYCNRSKQCNDKKDLNAECTQGDLNGNRDIMCLSNNCVNDTFDNQGDWYCAKPGECVNNGNRYNTGTIKCDNWNTYKQCNNGIWTTSTQCPANNECKDGTGCTPLPNLKITSFTINEVSS